MAKSAGRIARSSASATSGRHWHDVTWQSVSVSQLSYGERRMEAETYLSEGHGLRQRLARSASSQELGALARVWQPSRLKGTAVSPAYGTPFLSATQVFDVRPTPRKWLSLEHTSNAHERFLPVGSIIVTRSGAVGRVTLTYAVHDKVLITDDLLRVEAYDASRWGWLYAFLRSPQARAMMTGERYGHMIKHLEPMHLHRLPVPDVSGAQAKAFQSRAQEVLACRNRAHSLTLAAEERFEQEVGPVGELDWGENGFQVPVGLIGSRRRRMEAAHHLPAVRTILGSFRRVQPLGAVVQRVWWEKRFKRHYGATGIPYLSADTLFTVDPPALRRILVGPDDGHEAFFVKRGWLVMACSGQTYGLIGSSAIMTEWHEETFFSHDLIRIRPQVDARAGYLLTALTHPKLGRPLLIREAYGTSIPHLDPADVAGFPVVRLGAQAEDAIADLAEEAASERARADALDRTLAQEAEEVITEVIGR